MFDLLDIILLIIGILLYLMSIIHYKSFLNPIGIFSIIWGTLPYIYSLRLMPMLKPLSTSTHIALYVSFASFVIGGLLVTKRHYVNLNKLHFSISDNNFSKLIRAYWILLCVCIGEMFIKTPTLLTENPFGAYMEGTGVRFLHFATVILPPVTILLLINKNVCKWQKILMAIPPFFIPILWGQRGIALGYIIGVMFAVTILYSMRKQIIMMSLGLFFVMQMVIIVGSIRTGNASIAETARVDDSISPALVWAYTYTTPSIFNLDQTINNPDAPLYCGFEIVEPILSLMQIKIFAEEVKKNSKPLFQVYDGFNVPTYLYWCYLNFGYLGFFIVPFIIGLLLQIAFNSTTSGSYLGLGFYVIFMPNLAYSFHDFLFWNGGTILSCVVLILIYYRFRLTSRCIN